MKKTVVLLIGLVSALLALSLQAAPAQDEELFLPVVAGGGGDGDLPLTLSLETVVAAGNLQRPVDIANAGDGRLFVVERAGTIRIVEPDGTVLPQPFLDISDQVEWQSHSERGLLGLAFHPDYATNGAFFVNYTARPDGDTRISRFQVSGNPNVALPGSEELILEVDQPFANHNGGDLAFGPRDGYLYVALGDGGSGNDPGNRAQALDDLLGKILRLDIDAAPENDPPDCGDGAYRVPADNPFAGAQNPNCGEIWAYGCAIRGVFSFDAETDRFYRRLFTRGITERSLLPWRQYSCYEGTTGTGTRRWISARPPGVHHACVGVRPRRRLLGTGGRPWAGLPGADLYYLFADLQRYLLTSAPAARSPATRICRQAAIRPWRRATASLRRQPEHRRDLASPRFGEGHDAREARLQLATDAALTRPPGRQSVYGRASLRRSPG